MILKISPMSRNATTLKSIDKQIKIFTARKDYIRTMLNIEKSIPGLRTRPPRSWKLKQPVWTRRSEPLKVICLSFYLAQYLLCAHNFKYNKNNKKRTAEPILRPSKLTAKINENKLDVEDFKNSAENGEK
ncbi:hypothetical protein TNCV_3161791 [Trichonephila clavipes]|nr:hypothetical protein TNCV_3161791 [Trichonephila clavipes]